ncbi:MAG: ABC transporter permease subunit [Lachnospiraceae bacterium]|jgi:arabinogalactan oligomer/maltooligosaccharide transport system permease protein|nr:ABC transporter permease subunit [Lachnospiraceae bacterium]MDE7340233.1 ABC transporter permease subunit [Lachnospiraceae bacterium]
MKKTVGSIVRHLVLAFLAVIWLVPILWLVVTSFSGYKGINTAHFFPETWSLNNYKALFFEPDSVVQYGAWFKNTLIIAIFTCIVSTSFVLMVSYTMSCLRFKGRKGLMSFGIILNMFPGVLSMIAVYFVMKSIGLTNSHLGMIIVYSAGAGLGYLITKGFMDTISTSLREAAWLEGASEATIFFKIIIPLSQPIIVYTIINSFLVPWGDFVLAKLMLNSGIATDWTIAIGLFNMLNKSLVNKYFSIFCAGGVIVSIPISALFVLMQKFYVEGVTGGSVKG